MIETFISLNHNMPPKRHAIKIKD